MRILRQTTILAIISVVLLALIGSSFAACLLTAEVDCCEDDHDCDDPVCAEGAVCHCACAFSGVLPNIAVVAPIPALAGAVVSEPSTAFVSELSRDLFRPPRLS